MKTILIALSFVLLARPVVAQDNRPYSTCTEAANKLANRLAQDNIDTVKTPRFFLGNPSVKVAFPERKRIEKYSPTDRQYAYVVHFVGQRSVDLMASPVLLASLAEMWFDSCTDTATLTFAIFGSGHATTFGMNRDGAIKEWGCLEDLGYISGRGGSGNLDEAPKWGYIPCSI